MMFTRGDLRSWWIILPVMIGSATAISYNQPKFCPNVTWSANATTFAGSGVIGTQPSALFIDANNTVYVTSYSNNKIMVWPKGSSSPSKTMSAGLKNSYTMFVTISGDIIVDNGDTHGRVERLLPNGTKSTPAMYVSSYCIGLFVDVNDTIYCSLAKMHEVIKRSLGSNSNTTTVVAGTGNKGASLSRLNTPGGIFVDVNFDLYVADSGNSRVQRFRFGQLNATTVAGAGLNGSVTLDFPTGVILDTDKNLYIVDYYGNRVFRSGLDGFRCLVGCSGKNGSGPTEFYFPITIAFDSYGNIFVADEQNNRIQKFDLMTNSCDPTTLAPTTTQYQTQYTTYNQTTLISSIEQTSTTTTTTSTAFRTIISNQSCFSPNVTIIPAASTLNSPMQIRRSQDFYFISLIKINCNQSFSISTKWTVSNCTSTCSNQVQIDDKVLTTSSELYIPARTLPYGTYLFQLSVIMLDIPQLETTSSVYVDITPSGITANLVQYGTSMITIGYNQDLLLDPGSYSIDMDEPYFNATNWKYKYYCRIYGQYNFPNLQGSLITIDNPLIDPLNPSCLSNKTAWKFGNSINSVIILLSQSLQANRTYQFMVYMENRKNSSLQATGYLLVKVEHTPRQMIVIGCIIQTVCIPNLEFQLVNPTTQVALFSACSSNCSTIVNITWNVYFGSMNSSSNVTKWTLFNQTDVYENIWFFGRYTGNFTSTSQLFLMNPQVSLWRFEVVYQFLFESSASTLNFVINQAPSNGSCSISPLNGATTTLFTVACPDWFDEDGIKDYSLYYWTSDSTKRSMIAFSLLSTLEVRLPTSDLNASVVHLIVLVRDKLDCVQEVNLTSVTIIQDLSAVNDLLNNIKSNSLVRLLSSSNQNIVGQVLNSFSQQLNQFNQQNLDHALSNNIPLATISISQLGEQRLQQTISSANSSATIDFKNNLNRQANVREYLMNFTDNLPITTSNSILFQSSILSQLTQSTNQLTRSSALIASNKCYQLAVRLNAISIQISYEDAQLAADQLTQCVSNVQTAINGALQERIAVLDMDYSRANGFPADYDTDLDSAWSNPKLFAGGNDFSTETMERNRNLFYQKQIQNQINQQTKQTLALLTSALHNHMNIAQNFTINSSSVFMSLQITNTQSLSNQIIKPIASALIQLPSNFTSSESSVSLRSIVQPLAPADQSYSYTNLSTTISLSILDQNGNELSYPASSNNPY
ncbi:unnamed protein product [Adineta ricciae]|uniref:PKD/REJ-like domain-containing protein n=1 Tax=Adineta ricciae TaxID=249248 RepID=A0A815PR61_ADIRI|nr:unnamed protein product [Adineta ricciae]